MLRRILKWLLIGLPVLVVAGDAIGIALHRVRTDRLLGDPSRITWGAGDAALRVQVAEAEDGEKLSFRVRVVDATGQARVEQSLVVDRDMWGGGFVRSVQADDDPELEVVAWGSHERDRAFFLDHTAGSVRVRPFAEARAEVSALAQEWLQAHVLDPVGVVFLVILSFVYYVAVGGVWLVVRATRRLRARARAED